MQPLGLVIGPRCLLAPSTRLRIPPASARLRAKPRSPTQPSIRRWWPRLLRTGALGLAESARLVENLPDRTVKIWDVEQQRLLWTLSGHKATSVHDASSCFKAGCLGAIPHSIPRCCEDHVTAVGWSDRELQLASAGWDRRPATAYSPFWRECRCRGDQVELPTLVDRSRKVDLSCV